MKCQVLLLLTPDSFLNNAFTQASDSCDRKPVAATRVAQKLAFYAAFLPLHVKDVFRLLGKIVDIDQNSRFICASS
jgi:hypothetical protein